VSEVHPKARPAPLHEVPGAVTVRQVVEDLPCGKGVKTEYLDAGGNIVRGDYCVVIDEGFKVSGRVEQPKEGS
jgi:hypothetical protein